MMTVFGLIFKSLLGKFIAGIRWAIENWRITLPIAGVVCLVLFYNHYLNVKADRDAIAYSYKVHLAQDKELEELRKIENELKDAEYKNKESGIKRQSAKKLELLRSSYNAKLKDYGQAVLSANAMRDKLRQELEAYTAAARLPKDSGGLIRLAQIGADGNPIDTGQTDAEYIFRLEHACAITTADYNSLYDRCAAINDVYSSP